MDVTDVVPTPHQAAREQIRKLKARIELLKEGRSCMDCKLEWPAYVLSFDSMSKDLIVSPSVAEYRLKQLAKLDLVCANCLRIRDHKRNTGG